MTLPNRKKAVILTVVLIVAGLAAWGVWLFFSRSTYDRYKALRTGEDLTEVEKRLGKPESVNPTPEHTDYLFQVHGNSKYPTIAGVDFPKFVIVRFKNGRVSSSGDYETFYDPYAPFWSEKVTPSARLRATNDMEYFTLAENAEWHMNVKFIEMDGKVTLSATHRKIGPPEQRGGKTYFSVHTWSEGPKPFDSTLLCRVDASGAYTVNGKDSNAREQAEYCFPLVTGRRWKYVEPNRVLDFEVLGFEAVTVNETSYPECVHVRARATDASYVVDYWHAPQVGPVKSVATVGKGARRLSTLREYKRGAR